MNKLLLRICIALPLLPILVFVGLWLGVYWRVVWWAGCGAGLLWCAGKAFLYAKGGAHRVHGWLLPAALVQAGLWALAIAYSVDTDQPANQALHGAVGFVCGVLAFTLLLTATVGLGGQAVRLLRSNQAVPLQPRRALWGTLLLALNVMGWTLIILMSQVLSNQKTNLTIVSGWPDRDWPLFTPARYAIELLASHYIWMDDPATPQGWWPLSGALAEPDDVIRQYAHPTDRWSGAYRLTDERKENERTSKKRAFGLTMAEELDTLAAGAPATAPEIGRRVMDVKVGSPAELAGVQRGDTLIAINGVPVAKWFAAESAAPQTPIAKTTPTASATSDASRPAEPVSSLGIRTRTGALVTLNQRATFTNTGVQQVAWLEKGSVLYVRLDSFETDTAIYLAKALRELEATSQHRLTDAYVVIVDLRGNTGGRVLAAEEIGRLLFGRALATKPVDRQTIGVQPESLLAGKNDAERLIYTRFIDQHGATAVRAHNWTLDKNDGATRGAKGRKVEPLLPYMPNVLLLTNASSCSASEYLIHGLGRLSSTNVVTFGQTTCGKPYGFQPHDYAGYRVLVVDSVHLLASGQVAYPNGIAPTCKVIDPITGPFAAPGDAVFEAAMFYAMHQRCPG